MAPKDRVRVVIETLALQGATPEELDYAMDELLDEVREDLVAEAVKPREGVAAEAEEAVVDLAVC